MLAAVAATVLSGAALAHNHAPVMAEARMINTAGEEIGFATMAQGPHGVMIHVRVEGLEPGKKGLHLHSHGVCDHDHGFKTAKGHVGLKEGAHGLMNPDGPEAGDLPNIFIGADGVGETEIFTDLVNIDGRDGEFLLDEDGSTFVIHENADDHLTQPIGGAGARVACGVISAK